MNIRVDLTTPIKDGTEVVFRSPVDCSQITGLIVYFKENGNTASQEFALADAHGNNVGDIDHLFAENVVVKVILDVAHSMAFVQNADTNAYLEGRFDDIIDKLCPNFEKTGTVVQCEPLEGTELVILGKEAAGTHDITVCGKNLYNPNADDGYPMTDGYYINIGNGDPAGQGKHELYCATLGYVPVAHLRGKYITLNHVPGGTLPGMIFYDDIKSYLSGTGGKGNNIRVPDNAVYMRFTSFIADKDKVQIELGSAATDYEPFTIYGTGALLAPGESIVAVAGPGINTVYGVDQGTLDVAVLNVIGKADPVALIDKLTKAVRSLGGDV